MKDTPKLESDGKPSETCEQSASVSGRSKNSEKGWRGPIRRLDEWRARKAPGPVESTPFWLLRTSPLWVLIAWATFRILSP